MANETIAVSEDILEQHVVAAFRKVGTSEDSLQAATRAMMHASRVGVDSHGVRLTQHYCTMLEGGRLNKNPQLTIEQKGPSSATVDGDDGMGHFAAYRAMSLACELAHETGMAGVGVRRSSHLGAAGAYALAGAEAGFVSFATTNTDSMVPLFGGAAAFHGTNPLAFAAPLSGQRPWLLDMATSSIPMNRVLLYRSLDKDLPHGVAADKSGVPTTNPHEAEMVLPLGGAEYGYKGAALAGVATLLSSVLMGTTLDPDFIPMVGADDIQTPRNMGHFVFAISPDHFAGRAIFESGMIRYVDSLRNAPAREGEELMAPGDREWREATRRGAEGIPVDPDTARFLELSA
ncbi:Ldh family oxidoreductase [Devosia elaeis]|uniref:Oxidoreductase n=1 Tax=Devosia elaeis TaxID=1770058 RepID=A0A178HXK2_9HYPH|nr:Ldh family oxidoreductase [Devosia elaeis]OAM77459.1 oxidoreductase [Devosia elaeis]